ncbi:hypothetical protein [Consotaella aegiceratis]|uniref:hypothetical protein n=1 Tax=Consotaella aegiceratis TaxID=3097961 RepID=UPI002F402C33
MTEDRIIALLAEYGIQVIGKSRYPEPGQTRAPETVARIARKHGEEHVRLVLSTLAETANNGLCLDEVGFWTASDMIRACRPIIDRDATAWLELWDAMPIGPLQAMMQDLAGVVPQRFALDGAIYERVVRRFGSDQLDLLDDRRTP